MEVRLRAHAVGRHIDAVQAELAPGSGSGGQVVRALLDTGPGDVVGASARAFELSQARREAGQSSMHRG